MTGTAWRLRRVSAEGRLQHPGRMAGIDLQAEQEAVAGGGDRPSARIRARLLPDVAVIGASAAFRHRLMAHGSWLMAHGPGLPLPREARTAYEDAPQVGAPPNS